MRVIPPEACWMAKLRIFIDNMPSHGRYFILPRHIYPITLAYYRGCTINQPHSDIHMITVRIRDSFIGYPPRRNHF